MAHRKHRDRYRETEWKPGPDYRLICTCQEHARRARSPWRRAFRVVCRGVAVIVTVPLALAAFDIPMSAMDVNLDALRNKPVAQKVAMSSLQDAQKGEERSIAIFTRPSVSEKFLSTSAVQRSVTLDSFKEEFFRKHIPYGAIIYREAKRNGLAPELVAAMVHTESDFRVGLVSHKSAQGLMQIVPETARKLGINNVFDPEQNIAAGTRYYRYLLNRFDSERVALAAYNAGEGNVERWGGIPPFVETQKYVEKVNVRAGRYRQRVHSGYLATLRLRPDSEY